ncbi:nucleolar protein 8 [Engraulis encrasicolus]|uniref:nucleolar protein 8 n=1 Tax=Engraulis encrasicolus TaxID=184585 RepID=UPI002FCEEDF8
MITKRLYIGGLTHNISEKDLKDRFGKFGEVSDVELITRNDDHGNPIKTFGYININISDADFHKCMTVLNKSKWKGGTLQIEAAKESFLHKLAVERQQAAEKTHTKSVSHKEKIIDTLKQAGVENFHMKAAVPGTEIPGHTDWVVSKFGRVLPVLNLKCESKKKVIKYDPSKHCHNIKKLDTGTDTTEFTPVSKLTWEISGGDDEISKKRRGEFPPQKPKAKKIKKTSSVLPLSSIPPSDSDRTSENGTRTLKEAQPAAKETEDNIEVVGDDFLMRSILFQSGEGKHSMSSGHVRDDEEYDSADTDEILTRNKGPSVPEKKRHNKDSEIKLVPEKPSAKGKLSEKQPPAASKTAPLTKKPTAPSDENVDESDSDSDGGSEESDHSMDSDNSSVGSDYEAMMGNCRRLEISFADLEMLAKQCSEDEEEEEKPEASTSASAKAPPKRGITPEDILASLLGTASSEDESDGKKTAKKKKAKKKTASSTTLPAFMGTKDLFGMPDASKSESETGLKTQSKVAPVLSERAISKDASSSGEDSESDMEEEEEDDDDEEEVKEKEKVALVSIVNKKDMPKALPTSKDSESEDDDEEEEEDDDDDDDDGEEEEMEEEEVKDMKKVAVNDKKVTTKDALSTFKDSESEDEEDEEGGDGDDGGEEEMEEEEVKDTKKVAVNDKKVTTKDALSTSKDSESDSSDDDDDDDEDEEELEVDSPPKSLKSTQSKTPKETTCPSSASSDSSSEEEEEDDDDDDDDDDEDEKSKPSASKPEAMSSQKESATSNTAPPAPPVRAPQGDAEKQKLDNQKRLAALEQRLKESAQQKQLIQGALAKVDAPNTNKSKHIVFGSDEEREEEDEEDDLSVPNTKVKDLFEDEAEHTVAKPKSKESASSKPKTAGGSKLFDSSEEEEEESADDERFQIKPQFEGKAGHKLMELQSRFGADERFQMDSRFMESEDEEGEEEEEEGLKGSGKDAHAGEELTEEKNKNMEILRSVLNIDKQPSAVESAKTKIFRDISTLHYDPTREDHAAFEKKKEPKPEGKAAKRKKRAEAEKLPEVSKEIFYDVAVDLKQVFGSSATTAEGEKDGVAWDEKDEAEPEAEEEEMEMEQSVTVTNDDTSKQTNISLAVPENMESTGFKFSFFGEDEGMETDAAVKKDEYKIEALKGPKVSWQADPRFQDSSSEEEEEEEDTGETVEEKSATLGAQVNDLKPLKRMFFFYKDDERLKEGPQMFCRPGKLEDLKEEWESQRASLIEEYRKKHKAARKALKESYK